MCEHVWLIPPLALERANWRRKYRLKCKACEETRIVWGEFAQRMVLAKEEKSEVAVPKPKPSKRAPVEHDFSGKKEGWNGEYIHAEREGGLDWLAAGFEGVAEGDTVLLSEAKRYVVRKIVMPRGENHSWVAEVERALI